MAKLRTGTAQLGLYNGAFGVGAAAAAIETPQTVSGLVGWWDADNAASFTFSSGTVVSQWNDRSTSGKNLTQGTVANQPSRSGTQNGRSTVVFDGTNDLLANATYSLAQPMTILVAFKYDNADTATRRVVSGASVQPTIYTTTVWSFYDGAALASATTDDSAWNVLTGVFNTGTSLLYLNGASIKTGVLSGNALTAFGIGGNTSGSDYWDGEVAEVLIYNSVLNSTDRGTIEAYLKSKWGTV